MELPYHLFPHTHLTGPPTPPFRQRQGRSKVNNLRPSPSDSFHLNTHHLTTYLLPLKVTHPSPECLRGPATPALMPRLSDMSRYIYYGRAFISCYCNEWRPLKGTSVQGHTPLCVRHEHRSRYSLRTSTALPPWMLRNISKGCPWRYDVPGTVCSWCPGADGLIHPRRTALHSLRRRIDEDHLHIANANTNTFYLLPHSTFLWDNVDKCGIY